MSNISDALNKWGASKFENIGNFKLKKSKYQKCQTYNNVRRIRKVAGVENIEIKISKIKQQIIRKSFKMSQILVFNCVKREKY